MKEVMTVKQVAQYLQMDEHTVYKLARSSEIPSMKISGQWRFIKSVLDKWLEKTRLKTWQGEGKSWQPKLDLVLI